MTESAEEDERQSGGRGTWGGDCPGAAATLAGRSHCPSTLTPASPEDGAGASLFPSWPEKHTTLPPGAL